MKSIGVLKRWYPFSLYGSLLFFCSLFLAGTAPGPGTLYELSAALLMLLLLAAGTAGSVLKALRFRPSEIQTEWDSLLSAGPGENTLRFRCTDWPFGRLFRLHIRLTGQLTRGGEPVYRFRKEFRLDRAGTGTLGITPPGSGMLNLQVRFIVRDFLGLTGRMVNESWTRQVVVYPRRVDCYYDDTVSTVENRDDQSPVKPSDHEKVFNREYMAGDRFRDINWKAAARIQTLLTRIPPEILGSSRQIDLYVHNLLPGGSRGGARFLYEDCLKSLVFSFLEEFREQYPAWSCRVTLNRDVFLLSDDESRTLFLNELCRRAPESLAPSDLPLPEDRGGFFLFSSCLDTRLGSWISMTDREKMLLYLVQPHRDAGGEPDWDVKILRGDRNFRIIAPGIRLKRPERITAAGGAGTLREFTLKAGLL